jgi:hypothetical protein
VSTLMRWICVCTFVAGSTCGHAADVVLLRARTVDGSLHAPERMRVLDAEMQRECGAAPGSNRCHRLKRELQQEARNVRKQRRK